MHVVYTPGSHVQATFLYLTALLGDDEDVFLPDSTTEISMLEEGLTEDIRAAAKEGRPNGLIECAGLVYISACMLPPSFEAQL
jgi:hypothetical protein